MAKQLNKCKENQNKISENCTQSDFSSREETESLRKAVRAYDGSQIEKYQFYKYYYFGDSELEQTAYERAMLMTDLTLEEFYMMHLKLPARFTVNTTVNTNMSNYPLYTDFMFEYEHNSSESLTFSSATQMSHIAIQTDRNFNNSFRSNFAMETEPRSHDTYTEKNQFHKQYYYSGPAFERMSHDHNWNEVCMHLLCLERKPVPIFTASYTQKYTWYTCYRADECEIIPLSTDDPLHTYFMFEYEESIVTDSDVTTAHTCFMSKDNETMIATNSTLSHCTSGDDKKIAAKSSFKNSCTNSSEESFHDDEIMIAQLELTNNRTLAYFDDGTRIYAFSKARHHDDCYSNCYQDNKTVATVTLSDDTASNSTYTPEENKGKVSSKNNCSESGDKTRSVCVPTFNHNMGNTQTSAHVFANSSTFSNSTIRARSSSSDSWSGSSAYGAGAGLAVPFLDSDVAIAIIKVIFILIIAIILLLIIVHFVKKYFLQPKPKK